MACEVNHDGSKEESYFACTPPLEAKRMLLAKFGDSPRNNGIDQRLSFVDVGKAYFMASLAETSSCLSPGSWDCRAIG